MIQKSQTIQHRFIVKLYFIIKTHWFVEFFILLYWYSGHFDFKHTVQSDKVVIESYCYYILSTLVCNTVLDTHYTCSSYQFLNPFLGHPLEVKLHRTCFIDN